MSYEFEGQFTPQGWQCPICKRVYSPMTPMCYYCGGKTETWSTSTDPCIVKTVSTDKLDWMKHQTITNSKTDD